LRSQQTAELAHYFADGTSFADVVVMKILSSLFLTFIVIAPGYADTGVSVDAYGLVAFVHLDSDHNGYVSRVEARSVSGVESAFDSADLNRDGLLDQSEYTQVQQAREAQQ